MRNLGKLGLVVALAAAVGAIVSGGARPALFGRSSDATLTAPAAGAGPRIINGPAPTPTFIVVPIAPPLGTLPPDVRALTQGGRP